MAIVNLLDSIYHCASAFIWMKEAANRNVPALFDFAPVVCDHGSNH